MPGQPLGLVHEAVDPGLHGLNTVVVDEELLSVEDVNDSRDIGGDLWIPEETRARARTPTRRTRILIEVSCMIDWLTRRRSYRIWKP